MLRPPDELGVPSPDVSAPSPLLDFDGPCVGSVPPLFGPCPGGFRRAPPDLGKTLEVLGTPLENPASEELPNPLREHGVARRSFGKNTADDAYRAGPRTTALLDEERVVGIQGEVDDLVTLQLSKRFSRSPAKLLPLACSCAHVVHTGAVLPRGLEGFCVDDPSGAKKGRCRPSIGAPRAHFDADLVYTRRLFTKLPAGTERAQPLGRDWTVPHDDRSPVVPYAPPDGGVIELRSYVRIEGFPENPLPPRDPLRSMLVDVAQRAGK